MAKCPEQLEKHILSRVRRSSGFMPNNLLLVSLPSREPDVAISLGSTLYVVNWLQTATPTTLILFWLCWNHKHRRPHFICFYPALLSLIQWLPCLNATKCSAEAPRTIFQPSVTTATTGVTHKEWVSTSSNQLHISSLSTHFKRITLYIGRGGQGLSGISQQSSQGSVPSGICTHAQN